MKSWISFKDSIDLRMEVEAWTFSILWRTMEGGENHNGGKGCERKFLERDTSHLCIKCPTPTILTALMWKWYLNNNFTASSPFYHIQQSFNGTSILRNALRHIGGRLGYKEEWYKRKITSRKEGGILFSLRNRQRRKWIVYNLV